MNEYKEKKRNTFGFGKYQFVVNGLHIDAQYHEDDVEKIFKPLLRKWMKIQKEKDDVLNPKSWTKN